MMPILYVACGGAIGAVLRYLVSNFIGSRVSTMLPLGTLLVNVTGCIIIAFLVARGLQTTALSSNARLFFVVGIGGAYTTFSSFSVETLLLMQEGLYGMAVVNVLLSIVLCLLGAALGMMLARLV